jgi:deazaflavin-dependent oxidoreductase (nitroreductase family)
MFDYMRVADRGWPVLSRLAGLHVRLYRATGGRIGRRVPGLPPMLLLDHRGARTDKRRTTPLVYMPDGSAFVIVAAKGGHPANPAWVHNLRAHPETEVQVGPQRLSVRAREATAEERRELWPRVAAYNHFWDEYRRRTDRSIPIVILDPA